jgi:hypothetical protein
LKCSVVLLENSVPSFPGKRKQNPWKRVIILNFLVSFGIRILR